ncbi:MAG TPA: hypothetical protein VMZ90_08275 [Vicinamibacterales bacterium]|nr:hypothetical protein [Vicinamibacterales bacterium]
MSRRAWGSKSAFLALLVSVGCSGAGSPVSPAAVTLGSMSQVSGLVDITSKTDAGMVLTPGDLIDFGYVFTINGKHPATTVQVEGTTLTFQVVCGDGSQQSFTLPFLGAAWPVAENYTGWTPAGAQQDPAVWYGQGVASDVCGGGTYKPKNGATFQAVITADQNVKINVKFHWRANGSAGGYSSTKTVVPAV